MHTLNSAILNLNQVYPQIIPSLQNRSVISIHMGDYHYGALTSSGELLTWGQYSNGALGLGDPREKIAGGPGGLPVGASLNHWQTPLDVIEPIAVNFGTGKFCFGAAFAGWHSGALVLDTQVSPSLIMKLFHIFLLSLRRVSRM